MTSKVVTGLERLLNDKDLQKKFPGKIGYLCHAASVTPEIEHGLLALKRVFGDRLIKVFGPQHGFVTDVQDNMVESKHTIHPYFKLQVYSLYSETRIPTQEMLQGLDHVFVDLQDVGTRIYTYIYTMTYMMEACQKAGVQVVILDRPNPIDGVTIEGNVLDMKFDSFVGRHAMPVRHGLTMGEVARMNKKFWTAPDCNLEVIEMQGWKRSMSYEDTALPWVLPSPNLATVEAAYTFVGTVLYEGTNISEGRGTTRSLEIVGHPKLEAFSFHDKLRPILKREELEGFVLRPLVFLPTFQKHQGLPCGGFQIHVTNRQKFEPWRLCQTLCREFYHHLGADFQWKQPPYEYEYDRMPIDLINGTDQLRLWVEKNGSRADYDALMKPGMSDYLEKRKQILIYE
ncbi:MAG: exo-beta-N-acetylmuramidase NamZ domain-containing protein [Bacteriovoracia bacterium]